MKRELVRKVLVIAALMISAVFAVGMMAGCGGSGDSGDSGSDSAASVNDGADGGDQDGAGAGDAAAMPDHYTVEDSVDSSTNKGIGKLTAYAADGTEMWHIYTDPYEMTELSKTYDIGEQDNGYYIEAGGKVYCVDKADGTLLWRNDEFDGATSGSDFDSAGNLYLCGYYGPMLCVISPDGKMLHRYVEPLFKSTALDPKEYYWPTELKAYHDYVMIHFDSHDTTLYVDPENGHSESDPDLFVSE